MEKEKIIEILIKGFVIAVAIHGVYSSVWLGDLEKRDHPGDFIVNYKITQSNGTATASWAELPIVGSLTESWDNA